MPAITFNVTCINVDMDDIKNTLILSIFLHIITMIIIVITTSMTCYMYFSPLCYKNRIQYTHNQIHPINMENTVNTVNTIHNI
jgi:hypothetical protein